MDADLYSRYPHLILTKTQDGDVEAKDIIDGLLHAARDLCPQEFGFHWMNYFLFAEKH